MWHLIQEMLKDYDVTIEAKEIVGSYCPGSYDLSIRDQKFAGISQRRIRGGVAVKFISVLQEVALNVPHSFVIFTT